MCPRPRCNWKLDIYDEWQSFLIIRCCIPIIMEAIIVIDWPRRRDIVSQFTPLILRQFCIFRGVCNYSTQNCCIGMKAFTPHWHIIMPLQFIVIVHLQRFDLKSVALHILPFFLSGTSSLTATRPQLSFSFYLSITLVVCPRGLAFENKTSALISIPAPMPHLHLLSTHFCFIGLEL